MIKNDKINVFGIRHHGPGSARSLVRALHELQPDCILVEGPPEADELISHVLSDDMKPPVSLLIYAPDDFHKAAYYPFAVFSPEWQALLYGCRRGLPVRFIDLPLSNWLALEHALDIDKDKAGAPGAEKKKTDAPPAGQGVAGSEAASGRESTVEESFSSLPETEDFSNIRRDPLSFLARAAGYEDSERWWENLVEHRREDLAVFTAICEAMTTLRQELSPDELASDRYESLREASMRQNIRAALKQGFQKIAVICGAWHAPVLSELPAAREDLLLLKGLPRLKVASTWIPWTYPRLLLASGYGAGVQSPGWYHHLWTCEDLVVERWLARAARLLRAEDIDVSSGHIIEAVRLSEALASLRAQPLAGLAELSQAVRAVFCYGNSFPVHLIHDRLVVGDNMGEVPADLPGTPLQKNLEREQKRLRMPCQACEKLYDLDLRNENDLSRSHLLWRLHLIEVPWGINEEVTGKSGTFHEMWRLSWRPEFVLSLIEASVWGKTINEAAESFVCRQADSLPELSALTALLDRVLKADLPGALCHVMRRLENVAALAQDVKHLMAALPPLVQVARYGDVRRTDISSVHKIIVALVRRICVGLVPACSCLDDNAAAEVFGLLLKVHTSIGLLQNEDHERDWQETLMKLAYSTNISSLIAGKATRLLFDKKVIHSAESARLFGLSLSASSEPAQCAGFAEGFLRGSGTVLIHDSELFAIVDNWVDNLSPDAFIQILPLLRRTFSTYSLPERRQIGELALKSERGELHFEKESPLESIDERRAGKALFVLAAILGLGKSEKSENSNK